MLPEEQYPYTHFDCVQVLEISQVGRIKKQGDQKEQIFYHASRTGARTESDPLWKELQSAASRKPQVSHDYQNTFNTPVIL